MVITDANLSNIANSWFKVTISSSAEHVEESSVKPTISAYNILQVTDIYEKLKPADKLYCHVSKINKRGKDCLY